MLEQLTDFVKFSVWKTRINEIISLIGTSTSSMPVSNNISGSINLLKTTQGNLGDLNTVDKTSYPAAINEVNNKVGTLSNLNTTIKTNTVQAINNVLALQGSLDELDTSSNTSLVVAINETVSNSVSTLTSFELNHGRFSNETSKELTSSSANTISKEYNNSSFSITKKFINDNSDFGGSGGNLDPDVLSLIETIETKAGRTEKRYGSEFYINEVTCGSGTSGSITHLTLDYYPIINNTEAFLSRIGEYVTFSGWIRLDALGNPSNNGIILGNPNIVVYIDGIEVSSPFLLTDTDGWVHVRMVKQLVTEYDEIFPAIYANELDVIQIALPGFFRGNINMGLNKGIQ